MQDRINRLLTLGVSFEPNVQLERMPVAEAVAAGTYITKDFLTMVEVMGQDAATGKVTLEFKKLDSDEVMADTIGAELFNQLFRRLPPMTLGRQVG